MWDLKTQTHFLATRMQPLHPRDEIMDDANRNKIVTMSPEGLAQ